MDSLKGFNIGTADLAKKFKDVRRRTTQKVAEKLGVAETTHQNKAVGMTCESNWMCSWV
jgi:hypothetical protein